MMNVEDHARRYDAGHYLRQFGGVSGLDPGAVLRTPVPSADIAMHMSELASRARSARRILEIGPYLGTGSTLAFRAGVEESVVFEAWVTVDIVDHMLPWMKPHLPQWTMVVGDSTAEETVDEVFDVAGDQFDLIFIDTVHTYEHLRNELSLWRRLAHGGATWLFHDTWMLGQYNPMTEAIKEFASETHWNYECLSKECNGLGALVC